MKAKLLLFSLLLISSPFIFGQSLLTENFGSGTMPPAGWSIDAHGTNWTAPATAHAGGTAPEAQFFYNPSWTGTSRLMSPTINTTGYTSLTLSFKHMVDHYASPYTVGVATRSASGTWSSVWSVNPTASIGPETKIIQITSADVGSSTFQVCFYFTGYSYNINEWYFDDISLDVSKNRDAAMSVIDVPPYSVGSSVVSGTFVNMGINPITAATVNYRIDQGSVYSDVLTSLNLPFGASHDFSMTDALSLGPGNYTLQVWVSNVNNQGLDENPANDTLSKVLHVASGSLQRKPIYEEFTSSTCAPCAQFNSTVFTPFLEQYGDSITLIKYQMDWPGSGDPYYTEEGGVRRYFYGVSYVPDLYVDGQQQPTNNGGVMGGYTNSIATPAFLDVSSSYYFSASGGDTSVFVHLDISSKVTGNLTALVAVIEKVTYNNVSTNGETEFHNVMMKMVPTAYGTPVSLIDGETTSIDVSANLAGTNIERWNDLMVIAWVQDTNTREMFQASYGDSTSVGIRSVPSALQFKAYPNPTTGRVLLSGVGQVENAVLFDNTGSQVLVTGRLNTNTIDLGGLPVGIYLLRVETNDGIKTTKVNLIR